jgi:hypothetical protein
MHPFIKNIGVNRAWLMAAVVLGTGLTAQANNLLSNGSFETGNFNPSEPGSMLLTAGATDITGWIVINGGLAWDGPQNPYGLTASDGSHFLDLTGDYDHAPYGGVEQTVATTLGAQYQISFEVGSDVGYDSDQGSLPATPVSIQVTAGSSSGTFTTTTPAGNDLWQSFNLEFTATSSSTLISLEGLASENIEYIGLDNVDLEAVPEPGTLMLLVGPGLLAFAKCRRLRKA